MTSVERAASKLPVGVSRCLLGDEVRYDGGHKRDRYLTEVLSDYFRWVSVCPEVEAGLTTPRPPIRLVETNARLEVLGPKGEDFTERLKSTSEARIPGLRASGLRGFIFKKNSPSCGMAGVRLYREGGVRRDGVGMFAATIMRLWPHLPREEEGRLNDSRLRENFIEQVYTYDRWCSFVESDPTPAGLAGLTALTR